MPAIKPRRTLPTIRQHRPLWWRAGRELARIIVVRWARFQLRCNLEEVRGYLAIARLNGGTLGKNYMHNCRQQRKELRAKIADWNR